MTHFKRRAILTLLGGSALAACNPAPAVMRNAPDPFEGGIGGTGIVGTMTDFGSLIVNGLRVEVTGRTRFRTAFGATTETAAQPGRALTILATQSRDRLVARDVAVDEPLVGTLTRGHGGGLMVNGVSLRLEAGALGTLPLGSRVSVSGVWTRDGLSVSRVDPAVIPGDVISGVVGRNGPTGLTVAGRPVQLNGARPRAGGYLAVRGTYANGLLTAQSFRSGRFPTGNISLKQLSVEGYLEPIAAAPRFRIAGLGHSFDRQVQLAALARHRALYFGRYDGRFRAAAGYVVPDSFAARRGLLVNGFEGGHEGQIIRTR